MANLSALLKKAASEYESRKSAAESQVVRWEYWSGPAYDPKPYYFERALRSGVLKRGSQLAKPTARACAYGFDAQGRVVVDRQAKSADEPAFDEFFIYDKSGIESAAYRHDGKHALWYVTRQLHRNGRPTFTDELDAGARNSHSETYRYRDGRLSNIVVVSRIGNDEMTVKFDLVYEPDGTLRAIRRHYDYLPEPFPIYWNPASGETLDSLFKSMRQTLLDLIPKTVVKAKIKETAYCLALAYDVGGGEIPPILGVGLEKERQHWLATQGKEAKAVTWNPAEFSRYEDGTLDLDAPNLEYKSEKFLQMVLMKEALHIPQKLLNTIAADLNKRSWKGVLSTTDDFIVYAIDLEGDDFKQNLKAGVPDKKLKLLKSRRLL